MNQYLNLLQDVMQNGEDRPDRTGVGTRGVFGRQIRFNLFDGFPLLTTKKIHFRSVVYELLWFLRGDTNIRFLQENGVTIWDEWANAAGDLGPTYGKQWRNWTGIRSIDCSIVTRDQIVDLIVGIKRDPFGRRHIVSAWNPVDLADTKLPPCHPFWQCYVSTINSGGVPHASKLNLHLYMRSCDIFLGLPYNIASYALLLEILARLTGYLPGELVISFGDLHLYKNHFEQAREQLARDPHELPDVDFNRDLNEINDLREFTLQDFLLVGYSPHPAIKAPIAV